MDDIGYYTIHGMPPRGILHFTSLHSMDFTWPRFHYVGLNGRKAGKADWVVDMLSIYLIDWIDLRLSVHSFFSFPIDSKDHAQDRSMQRRPILSLQNNNV